MGVMMSQKEVCRQRVLQQVTQGRMEVEQAAHELGVSERTLWRLKARFQRDPVSICHGLRGKKGNRQKDQKALLRLRELLSDPRYQDCGPTFLRDELRKEGRMLSKESIRQELIRQGLWIPKQRKMVCVHQYRERRKRRGELLQSDGCQHRWFEGRGPKCTTLIAVDDATGRLESLYFCRTENLESYLKMMQSLVLEHGVPQALYTDRHGTFKVNRPGCEARQTQFHLALDRLGIRLICASTPQAKGRVERVFLTLQDRLVKWLRLQDISTIEDANAAAPTFILEYNDLFAKQPREVSHVYRPVPTVDVLERMLALRIQRKVSKDLSLSLYGQTLVLMEKEHANRLQYQTVEVVMMVDKPPIVLWKDRELKWRLYGHEGSEAVLSIGSKELNSALDYMLEETACNA